MWGSPLLHPICWNFHMRLKHLARSNSLLSVSIVTLCTVELCTTVWRVMCNVLFGRDRVWKMCLCSALSLSHLFCGPPQGTSTAMNCFCLQSAEDPPQPQPMNAKFKGWLRRENKCVLQYITYHLDRSDVMYTCVLTSSIAYKLNKLASCIIRRNITTIRNNVTWSII